jgi:hypothetical protein
MAEFAPLNDFAIALLGDKAEAAASELIRAIGLCAMRRAIEGLAAQGLLAEDQAAHLMLEVLHDVARPDPQAAQLEDTAADPRSDAPALEAAIERVRVVFARGDGGDAEPSPQGDPALDAVVPEPKEPETPGQASRRRLREIKARVDAGDSVRSNTKSKRPRKRQDEPAKSQRTCPVCGEPISRQATACRKHWRQVKRDRAQDPE